MENTTCLSKLDNSYTITEDGTTFRKDVIQEDCETLFREIKNYIFQKTSHGEIISGERNQLWLAFLVLKDIKDNFEQHKKAIALQKEYARERLDELPETVYIGFELANHGTIHSTRQSFSNEIIKLEGEERSLHDAFTKDVSRHKTQTIKLLQEFEDAVSMDENFRKANIRELFAFLHAPEEKIIQTKEITFWAYGGYGKTVPRIP